MFYTIGMPNGSAFRPRCKVGKAIGQTVTLESKILVFAESNNIHPYTIPRLHRPQRDVDPKSLEHHLKSRYRPPHQDCSLGPWGQLRQTIASWMRFTPITTTMGMSQIYSTHVHNVLGTRVNELEQIRPAIALEDIALISIAFNVSTQQHAISTFSRDVNAETVEKGA